MNEKKNISPFVRVLEILSTYVTPLKSKVVLAAPILLCRLSLSNHLKKYFLSFSNPPPQLKYSKDSSGQEAV